jgi:glycosyltransferase involved in cell wall biosynthesis
MHARKRPVIGWGLGVPAESGLSAGGLRQAARRNFLNQFDAILAYSQKGASEFAALGIDPQHIFVAPNAMAARPIQPPQPRPARAAGVPTVLFVGRLQERKRVDLLLRACAALPKDLQPRLWVVGEGPARTEWEAMAGQVYPAARFWGALYGPELYQLFRQADLFALPGTGGLAVQQAMSFALPVIVGEGDGTQSDLVRPGNGWSLPPDNLTALTAALAEALADFPRLRRMGAESYRIVSEEVNTDTMVNGFAQCIAKLKSFKSRL